MTPLQPLIVIADDDVQLVEVLARRCHALGTRVACAHDGLAATERIAAEPPDLVILDVNMPGRSGLDLREMLAGIDSTKGVPVIVLTGSSSQDVIRRCHEQVSYYVPKGADCWNHLQPLVCELLHLRPMFPPSESAVLSNPRSSISTNPEDPMSESPTAKFAHRPRVLCIDDDAGFADVLRARLNGNGADLIHACNGTVGYRTALLEPVAAIVLDYEMPEGDGAYTLRRLRETPGTSAIPVIALTGRRCKSIERQLYSLGAARYMTKPAVWSELWQELSLHLKQVPR